jgi:molybdenum cofactor cytidylyltransferase
MREDRTAALVLAGGASRRMGGAKLRLEHRGETLLARAVVTAQRVCGRVLVVVGAYAEAYRAEALRLGAEVVDNPDWAEGLASSLRAGVRAAGQVERVLVVLADQPFVTATHLKTLLETADTTEAELVFSRYPGGGLGAPTVITKSLFAQVRSLQGDRGAKALVRGAATTGEVPLADPRDVDTPEEATRWLDDAP